MSILPFKIHVPDSRLGRLKQKLALTDFPNDGPSESASSWDLGPPVAEIKRLATLWETSYDWRKVEAHLNTFPQYIVPVEVDGFGVYQIHHIHQRSTRSDAIPLLFLHGWPGSFFEVTKMLNDLVQGAPSGPSFHVVAPSLIDFGFSSASGRVSGMS
jgi:pimeloyl-ACP methyl ester carboxylesterase